MNSGKFNEQNQPLRLAPSFQQAATLQEQVIFALAELGRATAREVTIKLEELEPDAPAKQLIAAVHQILTTLHGMGHISAIELDGELSYALEAGPGANGQ